MASLLMRELPACISRTFPSSKLRSQIHFPWLWVHPFKKQSAILPLWGAEVPIWGLCAIAKISRQSQNRAKSSLIAIGHHVRSVVPKGRGPKLISLRVRARALPLLPFWPYY